MKGRPTKSKMPCNTPMPSWREGKKRAVKACQNGKERIIHYGAVGYGNNYSTAARKSFRARHKCDSAHDKLTARYWACEDLWVKGGHVTPCPPSRRCKMNHMTRPSYEKHTVATLRDMLRARGLTVSGRKAELITRLKRYDRM